MRYGYVNFQPLAVDMEQFNAVYKRWHVDKDITAVRAMDLLGLK